MVTACVFHFCDVSVTKIQFLQYADVWLKFQLRLHVKGVFPMDLFPNEQNFDLDKSIDKHFITA